MKKAPNKVNVFPQKAECTKLLNIALKTGADFAELFFESKNEVVYNVYSTANEPTMVFTSGQISGVGVRIIKENEEIYGSINEYSLAKLEKFVKDLADSFVGKQNTKPLPLGDSKPYVKAYEKLASKDDIKPVLDVLYASCKEMKKHSEFITQATASFTSSEQTVLIVNSNGIYQEDERVRSRLRFSCQAVNGEKNSSVGEAPGKSCGLELIDKVDWKKIVKELAVRAVASLDAVEMKSQTLPVIIHNGFGGVIFHEACGHPLEAEAIVKNQSVFSSMLGQQIASEVVNAVDDGSLVGEWGWQNFDDEGNPTQKNVLIENGILKNYLVDIKNGKKMNQSHTGSSRRESYKHSPTSRMNSTFIENGTSTLEEIISSTKYGLFAKSMGGGSVNPINGEFNFACNEAYMVRDGKICEQVKGATLIGNSKDVLRKIDMVAGNLELAQGVCGASSGSVPADVGQPTIRVSEMQVGGAKNE